MPTTFFAKNKKSMKIFIYSALCSTVIYGTYVSAIILHEYITGHKGLIGWQAHGKARLCQPST
jgi:hypothetical protein